MRKRPLNRFFSILFFLVGYTAVKGVEFMPSSPWWGVGFALGVFGLMISWQYLSHHKTFKLNERLWFRALAWVGSFTMGIWSVFVPLSFVTDLLFALTLIVLPGEHVALLKHFGFRELELIVLAASIAIAVAGYVVAAIMGPSIRQVTIPVENLPASLRGFKIAQVSDVHVGATVRRRYVDRLVRQANSVGADLIAVTGDLIDGWSDELTAHLEPLASLRAKHGVFYVTGNHEYYWDAPKLLEKVAQFGFKTLLNESVTIERGEDSILVGGITDPAGQLLSEDHVPNLKQTVAAKVINENGDFARAAPQVRILLSHRPGYYEEAEQLGYHVQLSGHTHGGQFFPYNYIIRFFHKYYRGLNRHGRLAVYVNPGSGYWALANRLGVRAEVTAITLESISTARIPSV